MAHFPRTRYRMWSTYGSTGFTSWVTKTTGVPRQAPVVPVDAEADKVAPANGQGAVEGLLLGHVAELVVAQPRRGAVDTHGAGRQGDEAEQHLEERGLADAVGTEHGEELAFDDAQIELRPQGP